MANVKKVFLTEQGKKEKEEELDHLISVARKEVSEKIKEARDFGDIAENAEYDAAMDRQAAIEQRIKELQDMLANVEIIKEAGVKDIVSLGCTVKLFDKTFKEDLEYRIVGTAEESIEKNLISNESPLAKAIIGKKVGETVTYKAPSGEITVDILEIKVK